MWVLQNTSEIVLVSEIQKSRNHFQGARPVGPWKRGVGKLVDSSAECQQYKLSYAMWSGAVVSELNPKAN